MSNLKSPCRLRIAEELNITHSSIEQLKPHCFRKNRIVIYTVLNHVELRKKKWPVSLIKHKYTCTSINIREYWSTNAAITEVIEKGKQQNGSCIQVSMGLSNRSKYCSFDFNLFQKSEIGLFCYFNFPISAIFLKKILAFLLSINHIFIF